MGCRHASFVFYICTCLIVLCSICTLQPDSTPFNELENFTPEKEVSSHFDIVKHFLTFLYLGFVTLLHQPGTVFGLSCTTVPIKKIGNSLLDSFWTRTCIASDAVLETSVTIRFHVSYNIVLGSDGYLYILSHFGCLPNASLDWPV